MTGRDTFKTWAPSGARWIEWIRPVQFVAIDNIKQTNSACKFIIPTIFYIDKLETDTAIFLDLPGHDSIEEGLALAKLGFRPIPLYNGTNEQQSAMALVDNHMISSALTWGALELEKLNISATAPPVFLLDSNRAHSYKMSVSIFDNSWDLYYQDIPSAAYFLEKEINRIIIRGDTIQTDLAKLLYNYQKKGIKILFTKGYDNPKETIIKKPSRKNKSS